MWYFKWVIILFNFHSNPGGRHSSLLLQSVSSLRAFALVTDSAWVLALYQPGMLLRLLQFFAWIISLLRQASASYPLKISIVPPPESPWLSLLCHYHMSSCVFNLLCLLSVLSLPEASMKISISVCRMGSGISESLSRYPLSEENKRSITITIL